MRRPELSLVQGTLDFLILKTLANGEPRHGFGILRFIRATTDGVLTVEEGSLYPALHRLEHREFLMSTWGKSENGRRAKFYRITIRGIRQLAKLERDWHGYVGAVAKVVKAGGAV